MFWCLLRFAHFQKKQTEQRKMEMHSYIKMEARIFKENIHRLSTTSRLSLSSTARRLLISSLDRFVCC